MRFKFYALWLCAVMIVVFVLQLLISGFTDLFVLNQQSYFQVWRFVTAVFLHGSLSHLVFNLFALALFGSILENYIGGKKFLLVFFVTGILANLVSVNFYNSSLGASGAIFGIIGALVIVSPFMIVWAFGMPMPMLVAGILWAAGNVLGIFMPTNVGNIAHLSGMAFGFVFGAYYRRFVKIQQKRRPSIYSINESSMRRWEDSYFR